MEKHEAYICYDKEDQITADTICQYLEDNEIKCWLKSRDISIKYEVEDIMASIKQSKVMILVFSEYSKHSNHVNTEVDIAFTEQIPIISFKIDESELDGGLEFFLTNSHWLDTSQDSNNNFDKLVTDTSRLLEKSISEVVVSKEAKMLEEKFNKSINQRKVKKSKQKSKEKKISLLSKLKIPIIALCVILIISSSIFAYIKFNEELGGSSDEEKNLPKITMTITDFHVSDVRNESTAWDYSYFVSGTINPTPNENEEYKLIVDFYDKSGNLVDSTETNFKDAQKVGDSFLFGSSVSDKNNIKRVEAQLINNKDIILAQSDSEL